MCRVCIGVILTQSKSCNAGVTATSIALRLGWGSCRGWDRFGALFLDVFSRVLLLQLLLSLAILNLSDI